MADKVEDKDFKAFCDALRGDKLSISEIKAGVEKYGFKYLSDSQKARFQAAIFPKPAKDASEESKKLGFQNLKRIGNVLKAMQELQSEGKISKDEVLSFMTEPHIVIKKGADGKKQVTEHKNAMSVIALNTYAYEFKNRRFALKGAKSSRTALGKNSAALSEIQDTLKEFDADILHKAFNTIDANTSGRNLKYSDLAKKSLKMKDAFAKAEEYGALHATEIVTVSKDNKLMVQKPRPKGLVLASKQQAIQEAEDPVRIGGMEDPLNISGADKETLNISAGDNQPEQKNEQNGEKVAQLDDPNRDSEKGKSEPFKVSPIGAKDLITYLYEAWFLGLINYTLQKIFNGINALGDWLAGERGQAPIRTSALAKATGKDNPDSHKLDADVSSKASKALANAYSKQISLFADGVKKDMVKEFKYLINKPDLLSPMLNCIKNNIGREPEKWGRAFVASENGTATVAFNPHIHKGFAEELNEAFARDKEGFGQRMTDLSNNPQVLEGVVSPEVIRICTHLATINYLRGNPGEQLTNNDAATATVKKIATVKMFEVLETLSTIYQAQEAEFRVKNDLAPDAKLSKKQIEKVYDATSEEFKGYMTDIVSEAKKLKGYQCAYYAEENPSQKEVIKQKMKEQEFEFDKFYDQYRLNGIEGRAPLENAPKVKQAAMDAREAAEATNKSERKEAAFNQDLKGKQDAHDAKVKQHEARKNSFERGKNKVNNRGKETGRQAPKTKATARDGL